MTCGAVDHLVPIVRRHQHATRPASIKEKAVNAFLRTLAALVIVAAVIRGGGLIRFAYSVHNLVPTPRLQLGLPPDHRVSGLIATDSLPQGTGVLWWTDSAAATAILPDASGRLRIGTLQVDSQQIDAAYLAGLDASQWPELPPQWQRISVRYWDAAAAVYVTAGPDARPGIAGIDDDGNGSVDDLGELGATGSDDVVVAPGQSGYDQAAAGKILAQLINRGALLPLDGELHLPPLRPPGPPIEVWLKFAGATNEPPQRICLHIKPSELRGSSLEAGTPLAWVARP